MSGTKLSTTMVGGTKLSKQGADHGADPSIDR